MTEKHYRKLKTAPELQRLMQWHYASPRYLRLGRPVAWVTSGAPVEILRALGIVALYPENYTALCGARRQAVTLCQAAEARGYSPDLCSYARTSLGSMYDPEAAPLGGLPRPDMLVACNNICGTVVKWYEAVAQHYAVPLFVLDMPFVHSTVEPHLLAYVHSQLEDLVDFLEHATGRRLNPARLHEAIRLANQATVLWGQIRTLCKVHPSPLNAPDLFVNMAPIVVLRGLPSAVHYYRHLKAETEERVRKGVGAIPVERYRLLWDNIAIWHHLYRFYNRFAEYGACFVVDTYAGGWSQAIGEGDPLGELAAVYTTIFLNQSLSYRVQMMVDLVHEFQVDGFVMHSNRSCKPYSLGQYAIRRAVMEQTGVPGLVIEADMCDARGFSEEGIRTRIEAFVESLAAGPTKEAR